MRILKDENNLPLCSYEEVGTIDGCTLVLMYNLLICIKENDSEYNNKINISLLKKYNFSKIFIGFYPIDSFDNQEKILLLKHLAEKGIEAFELTLNP